MQINAWWKEIKGWTKVYDAEACGYDCNNGQGRSQEEIVKQAGKMHAKHVVWNENQKTQISTCQITEHQQPKLLINWGRKLESASNLSTHSFVSLLSFPFSVLFSAFVF